MLSESPVNKPGFLLSTTLGSCACWDVCSWHIAAFAALQHFVRFGPKADKCGRNWIVRFVPILLQKSQIAERQFSGRRQDRP
jgi:hypothetical protein